ncbi:MAG: hypothetical protein L6R35_006629 [Caloplaca aegaea]|nr:MAG: hypothetical protein L6R35_006629 [Caloplaca aegaea]
MNLNGVIGLCIFLGSVLLCISASILVGFLRKRTAPPGRTDDGGQAGNISILTSSSSETSPTDISTRSHEDHDTPNTTLSSATTASAEGWDPANATPTAMPNNNFAQSQQTEEHSAQVPGSHHPTLHRISREPSPAQAVSHVEAGPSNSQPPPLARSVTQQLRSGSGEINRATMNPNTLLLGLCIFFTLLVAGSIVCSYTYANVTTALGKCWKSLDEADKGMDIVDWQRREGNGTGSNGAEDFAMEALSTEGDASDKGEKGSSGPASSTICLVCEDV